MNDNLVCFIFFQEPTAKRKTSS